MFLKIKIKVQEIGTDHLGLVSSSKNRPLGRFFLVVAMSVDMYISCPLPMQICLGPLIGPQIT